MFEGKSIGELLIIRDKLAAEIEKLEIAARSETVDELTVLDLLHACLLEHKQLSEIIETKSRAICTPKG